METVTRRASFGLAILPAMLASSSGQASPAEQTPSLAVDDAPLNNVRIGTNPSTEWTVSTVTNLPASGVVAVGANSAGGEFGTFNGTYSVHVGYLSGSMSGGGYCQVGIGLRTLRESTAAYCTGVGTDALMSHRKGNNQVALGAKAMLRDVDGSGSTVLGAAAAYVATKILNQTIVGEQAARDMPLGEENEENVIVGYRAALERTGGRHNVEIGGHSGGSASTVNYCVHVGRGAGRATPDKTSLAGAIGYNASPSGSLRFRIGGPGQVPEAAGGLQVISDKRHKIRAGAVGVDVAKSIVIDAQWVTFYKNPLEAYAPTGTATEEQNESWRRGDKKGNRIHAGIFAQDEHSRLASRGIDFSGLQHAQIAGGLDLWTVDYAAYVPYMAVIQSDQDSRIKELEAKIAFLEKLVSGLAERM